MRMHRLMMPAVTLAGALALAGCGGGSGTTTTGGTSCPDGQTRVAGNCVEEMTEAQKAADTAIKAAIAASGELPENPTAKQVSDAEELVTAAETAIAALDADERADATEELTEGTAEIRVARLAIDLGNTATNRDIAIAIVNESQKARQAVDKALEIEEATAKLADKLDAKGVNGSSKAAYDNALEILTARGEVQKEYNNAKDAVDDLKKISKDTLDADGIETLDLAIKAAEEDREAIKAILDAKSSVDGSLAASEGTVRSGTKVGETNEKIAQGKADEVAVAIRNALRGNAVATPRPLGTAAAAAPGPTDDRLLVLDAASAPEDFELTRAGMAGRTFEDITGEAFLDVTTLGTVTIRLADVDQTARTADLEAGSQRAMVYRGIPGQLRCAGSVDCTFNSNTGAVEAGAVVFFPDDAEALYVQETFDGNYMPLTNAAAYGYWLTATNVVLHYSSLSQGGTGDANEPTWAEVGGQDDEATYKGQAGGYSYRFTGEGDDLKEHSGEFTANVELEAEFGDEPTLEGSISGFKGVGGDDHVNTNWYVGLNATDGSSSGAPTADGIDPTRKAGMETATAGSWNFDDYGEGNEKNPAGLVGAFSAGFTDGNAAGVFNAETE